MSTQATASRVDYLWLATMFASIVACTCAALFVGSAAGVAAIDNMELYAARILLLAVPIFILLATGGLIYAAWRREPNPVDAARRFLKHRFGSAGSVAQAAVPLALLPLLFAAYGTFKVTMPMVRPFLWDDALAELGKQMLGGMRPWQVTHALFGSPLQTMIIDRVYTAWISVMYVVALVIALFGSPHLRARFFLSFTLAWLVLGIVGAYVFSSAGPCFAAQIGASAADDFAPLMERLRAIDASGYTLGALRWQKVLWDAHSGHQLGFAMGVSAFPSMHNAIAFLYVLAAQRASLKVRIAAWTFAATILVGSVHLGWHYLADGLFAWAATAGIWWAVGAYLRFLQRTGSQNPAPAILGAPTAGIVTPA